MAAGGERVIRQVVRWIIHWAVPELDELIRENAKRVRQADREVELFGKALAARREELERLNPEPRD